DYYQRNNITPVDVSQARYYRKKNPTFSLQTVEEIMKIVEEAKSPPRVTRSVGGFGWGEEDGEEDKEILRMMKWRRKRMTRTSMTSKSRRLMRVGKFVSLKKKKTK
ncbi:Serine/threonine-protein kinase SRK2B, partial [Striga hermonthica]